jgi:hypothetical protein
MSRNPRPPSRFPFSLALKGREVGGKKKIQGRLQRPPRLARPQAKGIWRTRSEQKARKQQDNCCMCENARSVNTRAPLGATHIICALARTACRAGSRSMRPRSWSETTDTYLASQILVDYVSVTRTRRTAPRPANQANPGPTLPLYVAFAVKETGPNMKPNM